MRQCWQALDETDRFFCAVGAWFLLVGAPFVAAAAWDFFAEISF